MKYLKYILAVLIVVVAPSVYADEFNMNSYTSATAGGTRNRYRGTEIYNTGQSSTYTFGTRYQGQLSDIETYFYYPFEGNTTYRFTYNMATNDFNNNFSNSYWWDCDDTMTNNNAHVFIPTYISYKKIQFSLKPSENTTCIRVWVRSPNLSSGNITQISNWNLSSITLYDPDWQSGSGGGQGTTPTPTPTAGASNQDIINNNNENTQDIINNQNDNTNSLIENNNENTQKIVDALEDCYTNIFNAHNYSTNQFNNVQISDNEVNAMATQNWRTLEYQIPVETGEVYTIHFKTETVGALMYEDSNGTFQSVSNGSFSQITTTGDTLKVRLQNNPLAVGIYNWSELMLVKGVVSVYIPFGQPMCSNKLDNTTAAINDLNDTMKNDNIDNGLGGSFFSDFDDQDFGLSSIITIPLNTIQSLTSTSCQTLTIPIPFTSSSVPLPCMSAVYEEHIPTVYYLWKVVSFGLIAYFIAIDIFKMVKGFKDPESDKVEVLDL